MYEAVIYFAGPKTLWGGKVADEEIIMRKEVRWQWLARAIARSTCVRLDPQKTGYVVLKDGNEIEHVEPDLQKIAAPIAGKTARIGR